MDSNPDFRLVMLRAMRFVDVPARGMKRGMPFTINGFPTETWGRLFDEVSRPFEVPLSPDAAASFHASRMDGGFVLDLRTLPHTPPTAFWHFYNGWWSLFERYWTLAQADSSLQRRLRNTDEFDLRGATAQLPVRRLLFEFYTNATAVLDHLGFLCFALGALLLPSQFPMRDSKVLRRVDLSEASHRFDAAFPVERLTRALRQLLLSQELVELKAARNLWAHRGAPGFTTGHYPSDPERLAGFDWATEEHFGHESQVRALDTRLWRVWLGVTLAEVLKDSISLYEGRSAVPIQGAR